MDYQKKLLRVLKEREIKLIEDVCESHGAMFGKKMWYFWMVLTFPFTTLII